MPLVRITLAQGRAVDHRRAIADGVHQALVETAAVPADDRFRRCTRCRRRTSGGAPRTWGSERTAGIVFVQVFLNAGRTVEVKQALYARIAEKLASGRGCARRTCS